MTQYTDTFGSATVPPSEYGYQALSISSNTTLEWPYNSSGGTVVSKLIDLTATVGALSLTMPDATQVSTGEDVLIRNIGAQSVTVKDNAGGTIGTVAAGAASYFYLTSNSTAAGTWGLIAYGVGTSNVDAATLVGYGLMASGTTLNQASPVTTDAGAAITITSTYRAKTLVLSGGASTVSLTAAATLGDNFFFFLRNSGTGTATIDPSGGEFIDGVATLGIQPGESLMLVCSGAAWYTVGYGRAVLYQFSQLVKDVSAAGTITLTASEASNKLLTFNGNPGSNLNVVVPNTVAVYYVQSSISTAKTITVKTAAGTGSDIAQSQRIIMICDGTNVVAAQSAAATSAISYPAGSAAAPSINFAAATNTGIFLKGANGVGISANGTEGLAIETTGTTIAGHVTVEGVTSTGATGTGKLVFDASPTLVTPALGTPASGTLTNCTGLPPATGLSSITGTGAAVLATSPTISAPTISGHPTIEGVTSTGATGTGKLVYDTSPTFVTPALGTPASGNLANCTGYPVTDSTPTGVVLDYVGTTSPSGWVMLAGKTIGDGSSGGTERANADTVNLFTLLWNSMSDTEAPVSGGRGASAAADYAAHKTITVPDGRGRTIAGKDNMGGSAANRLTAAGSGITGTTLGAAGGAQTHTLIIAEMPVHDHTISGSMQLYGYSPSGFSAFIPGGTTTTSSSGSGNAHQNTQPTLVLNKIIKL